MRNINSTVRLNNSIYMPAIGLGVWQAMEGEEVENAVKWALSCGYRMIDTAQFYENEEGVGKAILDSGVARSEIFLTTKLWNDSQGYAPALAAFEESLQRFGMDYVDLYLIHWPFSGRDKRKNKRKETWQAMEEIYATGRAKSIGVSNYTIEHLEEMKGYASVPPAVNQVEFHPFLYQKDLLEYCQKNRIALEAYSPLVRGQKLMDDRITTIAEKYNKSNAQLLIRWSLQIGCVVIPKSVHKERIEENINVFDFEISDEDMQKISSLNENIHVAWDPY